MGTPRRRSKRANKSTARDNAATPSLHGGPLSAADFDQSKCEIMYPHFIEEGLLDPPEHMNK
jgi:hypothetical protein